MPNANNLDAGEHTFGFNGKMDDKEMYSANGTSYDFGARMYDSRLGRFLSTDPKIKNYPFSTPYSFAGDNPITYIDHEGENPIFFMIAYFFIGTLSDAALQYSINYAVYNDPTIAFEHIDWFDASVTGIVTAATSPAGGLAKMELTLGNNLAKTVMKKVAAGELIEASVDYDGEGFKFIGKGKNGTEVAMDLSTALISKKLKNLIMNQMKLSSGKAMEYIIEKNTMSPDLRTPHEVADKLVNSKLLDEFFSILESGGNQLWNESIKNGMNSPVQNSDVQLQFDITKGSTLEYQLQNGATRIDNTRVNMQGAGATLNGIKNLLKAKPPVREVYHSVRFL